MSDATHADVSSAVSDLSERERQVLELCAEGLSNREIAEALFLGVETVRTHLKRAYRHLGVRNRTEAAAAVHRGFAVTGASRHETPADSRAALRATEPLAPYLGIDDAAVRERLALVGLDDSARQRLLTLVPAVR